MNNWEKNNSEYNVGDPENSEIEYYLSMPEENEDVATEEKDDAEGGKTAVEKSPEEVKTESTEDAEVEAEDDAELQLYLQTHFYNYEEFQNPPADFDYKIVFDTIAGVNADKIPLIEQVQEEIINFQDVPHTLYYIIAREGVGENPVYGHEVITKYQGSYIGGEMGNNELLWHRALLFEEFKDICDLMFESINRALKEKNGIRTLNFPRK